MGVDADIAVSEVVDRTGRDLVAAELSAVSLGDRSRGIKMEGRIRNVDGTCYDTIELILVLYFAEIDVFGLRSALEIVLVGFEVDNAVLELHEFVSTCAKRLRGLRADQTEIALGESEGVVLIIELGRIAVVMERSDRESQLIDHGRVDFGGHDAHAVIVDLLDTGDIGSGITGLDTDRVLLIAGHQGLDRGTGVLCADHRRDVAIICLDHLVKSIRRCNTFVQSEAPVREACRDRILCLVIACRLAVVADLVDEGLLHAIDF